MLNNTDLNDYTAEKGTAFPGFLPAYVCPQILKMFVCRFTLPYTVQKVIKTSAIYSYMKCRGNRDTT